MTPRHKVTAALLTMLWWGLCAVRYRVESQRADECFDLLRDTQLQICVRNAIESRDSVISWALGVPLVLVIGAAFLVTVLQIERGQR
jgi:hypothetical protein